MEQVTAVVSKGAGNRAVFSQSSSPVLNYVTAVASDTDSYGLYLDAGGGSLKAFHSVFQGGTKSVFNASGTAAQFGSSRLHGTIDGPCVCVACYNDSFVPVDAGCH
jgi:hypothetical protein